MKSIKSRQLGVHTYNEETAEELRSDIVNIYFDEFKKLSRSFEDIKSKEQ